MIKRGDEGIVFKCICYHIVGYLTSFLLNFMFFSEKFMFLNSAFSVFFLRGSEGKKRKKETIKYNQNHTEKGPYPLFRRQEPQDIPSNTTWKNGDLFSLKKKFKNVIIYRWLFWNSWAFPRFRRSTSYQLRIYTVKTSNTLKSATKGYLCHRQVSMPQQFGGHVHPVPVYKPGKVGRDATMKIAW